MDRQRWDRVYDLAAGALERPAAARSAWLAQACRHTTLRREVASLLAIDSAGLDALEQGPIPHLRPAGETVGPGQKIGPYRLVEELGRGGMGVVFLAERVDGEVERQVALKVSRRGLDNFVDRFYTERQILANLEHPSIAQLYEAGTTQGGMPYFAMELVKGERIDHFCRRRHLALRSRLELVVRVCRAVAFAHRNLVVHRDLKPGNILVTARGQPKLLDFGIAKLVDPRSEAAESPTAPGVLPMTPEYASPEQVMERPITTATDVHALGILLYELLTGRRPFRVEEGSTPDELRRAICERQPEKPSAAVWRAGSTATGTLSEDPARLRRQLRGDLDNIVLKALAKEAHGRYATVDELAEDLERHLAGRPVRARPPTLIYRGGKLVRRNAGACCVLAISALVLAAFLADRGLQQRRTHQALVRAERVTDLLVEVFEVSNPSTDRGQAITAREMLDRGTERVREQLGSEPVTKAALLAALGRAHHGLGLYPQGESLLREALALRLAAHGGRHPEVADSLHSLGLLLISRGDYEEAERVLRRALHLSERVLRQDPLVVAQRMHGMADVLQLRGNLDEARDLYLAVARSRRARLEPDHPDQLESLNDLAAELLAVGDRKEAERLFREVLAARRHHLGAGHPDVAKSANNLAYFLYTTGAGGEVEGLLRQALEIHRRALGVGHPDALESASILGQFLQEQGDHAAAERLLRDSLAHQERVLGPDHPDVIASRRELAVLLRRLERFSEAEEQLQLALTAGHRSLGEDHPGIVVLLNNLGNLRLAAGDPAGAEQVLDEALAMSRRLHGGDSLASSSPLQNLGNLYRSRGDAETAEQLYRQVLELRRQALPHRHPKIASTLLRLARLWLENGRPEDAEPVAREAIDIYRNSLPPGHWQLAAAEAALGAALAHLGRHDEAEPILVASYDRLRQQVGASAATLEVGRDLVDLYEARGQPERSAPYRPAAPAKP